MALKINEVVDTSADLYQDNVLIGTVKNILQFNDVRLQVRTQKLEGVYLIWKNLSGQNYHIYLDVNGNYEPIAGFFDTLDHQLQELAGWA